MTRFPLSWKRGGSDSAKKDTDIKLRDAKVGLRLETDTPHVHQGGSEGHYVVSPPPPPAAGMLHWHGRRSAASLQSRMRRILLYHFDLQPGNVVKRGWGGGGGVGVGGRKCKLY